MEIGYARDAYHRRHVDRFGLHRFAGCGVSGALSVSEAIIATLDLALDGLVLHAGAGRWRKTIFSVMKLEIGLVFVAAALLEVIGDAVVRHGLRGRSVLWIVLGSSALALYGLMVNSVPWDFSKLMGVYVGFFAATSVLIGRFAFRENVPVTTWLGLALIIGGGLCIQSSRW
jgi:small multidrug resistance family-3 protein